MAENPIDLTTGKNCGADSAAECEDGCTTCWPLRSAIQVSPAWTKATWVRENAGWRSEAVVPDCARTFEALCTHSATIIAARNKQSTMSLLSTSGGGSGNREVYLSDSVMEARQKISPVNAQRLKTVCNTRWLVDASAQVGEGSMLCREHRTAAPAPCTEQSAQALCRRRIYKQIWNRICNHLAGDDPCQRVAAARLVPIALIKTAQP